MNEQTHDKLEAVVRTVCEVLNCAFVEVAPLSEHPAGTLWRIAVRYPSQVEVVIQEWIGEAEIRALPEWMLARTVFCAFWQRSRYAGLAALAAAYGKPAADFGDCSEQEIPF